MKWLRAEVSERLSLPPGAGSSHPYISGRWASCQESVAEKMRVLARMPTRMQHGRQADVGEEHTKSWPGQRCRGAYGLVSRHLLIGVMFS